METMLRYPTFSPCLSLSVLSFRFLSVPLLSSDGAVQTTRPLAWLPLVTPTCRNAITPPSHLAVDPRKSEKLSSSVHAHLLKSQSKISSAPELYYYVVATSVWAWLTSSNHLHMKMSHTYRLPLQVFSHFFILGTTPAVVRGKKM